MPLQKREIIISLFILLSLCAAIFFLSLYGRSNRIYAASAEVITIPEPYRAFAAWKAAGVKGRILFLFDRDPHTGTGDAYPIDDNYVYLAIRKDIVRKVYHIIPDNLWPEVERILTGPGYTFVTRSDNFFRFNIDGASILIMRLKDIPRINEKVLININGDYVDDPYMHRIAGLLRDKVLNSDIITISGKVSENNLKEIRVYESR